MKHIFLDSSVLLSFCRSKSGASALVIEYCKKGKIKGYLSKKVVFEVRKNAQLKMDKSAVERFEYILQQRFLQIEPDAEGEKIENAAKAIHKKDAPILAAALQITKAKYILSLDADFFEEKVKEFANPVEILKPGEFINRFRSSLEK
jgi:predicted nucleic acid-binding protein